MLLFLSLLVSAAEAQTATVAPLPAESTIFHSKKSLPVLEKCLTERLSQIGEVTSVPIENAKTLMFSTTDEPPMMIDIAPPDVKVTTKFAIGTEPIIKGCL